MPNKTERASRLCLYAAALLALALCLRWQRVFYLMCADYIRSDMPAHVRLALGRNDYSLASWIVRLLWGLFGEERGQTALSLVLTANQLFSIAALWLLLRRALPRLGRGAALLAAVLAHVCGPWIVPGQTAVYLGAYNGNVLHNMTLHFSRSFVPLDLLLFCRLWDARREKLEVGVWLGFALCLLVTTLFKPSFLGAFAPAVFLLLVWDFFRTRCRGFLRELMLGLAVIPSLAALVWSSTVLYAEDFAGTSSGMALRALSVPLVLGFAVMYLRGLLLPIWSFAVQGRREEKRGWLSILALTLLVAIAEALLLTETGFRANDGNFEWGALTLYPAVFGLAAALLFERLRDTDRGSPAACARSLVGAALLLGHLAAGLYCLYRPGRAGYDWFYF